MKPISEEEILRRFRFENPWWGENKSIDPRQRGQQPRAYLDSFLRLTKQKEVQRAIVLMGPRRVGKTWLLHHTIQRLMDDGHSPNRLCYISIDSPVYIGLALDNLLGFFRKSAHIDEPSGSIVIFDEIQYLPGWEVHLKKLVEDYPNIKFVASGSAAAALKLKSVESGAGRFTEFLLPPLTFHEFLLLLGKEKIAEPEPGRRAETPAEISALNNEFLDYLNFGGYPEALFSAEIQADPQRFIRSDIIDKVLLRDLPSLYGIEDIQELNRLFTMLAYNTASEVSLEKLSTGSGVAKNTIKRYLEYLEAAFLIVIVHRIDQSGRKFKRANFFKVYLTNPSMRCALFGPLEPSSEAMGPMAETAVYSQFLHWTGYASELHYARWNKGEVDFVHVQDSAPPACLEVKWSDSYYDQPSSLKSLLTFMDANKIRKALVTTISKSGRTTVRGHELKFVPTSIYCYATAKRSVDWRRGREQLPH